MAVQIAQTSKAINQLIDSLPGIESSEQQQIEALKSLEIDSDTTGELMKQKVKLAEQWLQRVQGALREITEDRLSEDQHVKIY